MKPISYADSGVNIEAGNEAVRRIKRKVESTFAPQVMGGLGGFGALYDLKPLLKQYQHPVMVQSIDGVGTKIIVARMANDFSKIGHDLLSACSNDILVLGAKTLTLLDYIANDTLNPTTIESIVSGMCDACRDNEVSLVGGETAEMPNTYLPGEHDLVGVVTGVVEKDKIIDGSKINEGDMVFGMLSSGLHTNGYSLARKLLFDLAELKIDSYVPELQHTVAEALLAPHINYAKPIFKLLDAGGQIHGMAHITGGGFLENIPRVLPNHLDVEIELGSWPMLPLFPYLSQLGQLSQAECYRVFNMGIGLIVIGPPSLATLAKKHLPEVTLYSMGRVIPGSKKVQLRS